MALAKPRNSRDRITPEFPRAPRSIEEAESALADTMEQNPVLKKAGVIDAGGKGFHVLDLRQLQGAVLLGLVEGAAGGVRMDVDFKGLDGRGF